MATPNSDTTLTDRRGCLDRTFDARSCTHIEMDMRCAIRTSSVMNSSIPDCSFASRVVSSELVKRRILASSALTARNDDGMAVRTMEMASTMPMSSSSERCDSLAESSSSDAMPKLTENARSEPRVPRAPAVALMPPPMERKPPLRSASSVEVKAVTSEVQPLGPVLAWQSGVFLLIRHMLTSPILTTNTPGQGGKAPRQRSGRSRVHQFHSSVVGCTLGNVVHFARGSKYRVSEVMRVLRKSLEPASMDLMSCSGADAELLQTGFASFHAVYYQVRMLVETKSSPRIEERYGRKSVVLGASVTLFFILSVCLSDSTESDKVREMAELMSQKMVTLLGMWPNGHSISCKESLEAERRAVERGLQGLLVAKGEATRMGLNHYNAVHLELAFMRKAMYPCNKTISKASQSELMGWIHSSGFMTEATIPAADTPWYSTVINVPLSALPELSGRAGRDSDADSMCDSASSGASLSSASSCDAADVSGALNNLTTVFANIS